MAKPFRPYNVYMVNRYYHGDEYSNGDLTLISTTMARSEKEAVRNVMYRKGIRTQDLAWSFNHTQHLWAVLKEEDEYQQKSEEIEQSFAKAMRELDSIYAEYMEEKNEANEK